MRGVTLLVLALCAVAMAAEWDIIAQASTKTNPETIVAMRPHPPIVVCSFLILPLLVLLLSSSTDSDSFLTLSFSYPIHLANMMFYCINTFPFLSFVNYYRLRLLSPLLRRLSTSQRQPLVPSVASKPTVTLALATTSVFGPRKASAFVLVQPRHESFNTKAKLSRPATLRILLIAPLLRLFVTASLVPRLPVLLFLSLHLTFMVFPFVSQPINNASLSSPSTPSRKVSTCLLLPRTETCSK